MRSVIVGVVLVLVVAVGCSDSDDTASTPAVSDTEASATTAADPTTSTPPDASTPPTGSPDSTAPAATSLLFTVDGVTGGSNVPIQFTCDGAGETPAVTIESVPSNVVELALIVDDPDAPTDSPFVHWAVYGIGPETSTVTDGDASLTYGVNDSGTDGWLGPCPPPGDGLHTYRWKLFGLSAAMDLEAGLDGRALEAAIADAVVTDSLLIASYERAT